MTFDKKENSQKTLVERLRYWAAYSETPMPYEAQKVCVQAADALSSRQDATPSPAPVSEERLKEILATELDRVGCDLAAKMLRMGLPYQPNDAAITAMRRAAETGGVEGHARGLLERLDALIDFSEPWEDGQPFVAASAFNAVIAEAHEFLRRFPPAPSDSAQQESAFGHDWSKECPICRRNDGQHAYWCDGENETSPAQGKTQGHDPISFHHGIKAAIRWLHARAASMADGHARSVLDSAATNLGWASSKKGVTPLSPHDFARHILEIEKLQDLRRTPAAADRVEEEPRWS